jgi:hypothetical protein
MRNALGVESILKRTELIKNIAVVNVAKRAAKDSTSILFHKKEKSEGQTKHAQLVRQFLMANVMIRSIAQKPVKNQCETKGVSQREGFGLIIVLVRYVEKHMTQSVTCKSSAVKNV